MYDIGTEQQQYYDKSTNLRMFVFNFALLQLQQQQQKFRYNAAILERIFYVLPKIIHSNLNMIFQHTITLTFT